MRDGLVHPLAEARAGVGAVLVGNIVTGAINRDPGTDTPG